MRPSPLLFASSVKVRVARAPFIHDVETTAVVIRLIQHYYSLQQYSHCNRIDNKATSGTSTNVLAREKPQEWWGVCSLGLGPTPVYTGSNTGSTTVLAEKATINRIASVLNILRNNASY